MGKARKAAGVAFVESIEQNGGYSGIHLATFMEIYHLKNAELEPKLQKYKGRIVLQGDIVEDDAGS